MSLKELPLPSIASLRAIAALKNTHLSPVRPARIGLGFESAGGHQKTLADVERMLGGPGRLSLPYSLRWLLDAMCGLGVLHRTLGFVHGEVQPDHIVLGDDGVGRLIPVVRAHWVRGEERAPDRLYYLAPEKLLGDRVDLRSDVFSFGVLLWEAVSAQPLLEAYTVDDIIARLMSGGIPRAHAPEGESWTEPLSSIAERAIAVDPGRRFGSLAEMKEAVEAACSRYLASTPGMVELFQDPQRRTRGISRDSSGPDSQRITLPPHQAPATSRPREGSIAPAATTYGGPEEELKTRPNAAPLPSAARRPHVSTLMGNAPPFIERERDSSPHDELTTPFARLPIPPSAQVLITPLPVPPSTPVTPLATASAPARRSTPLSFPPPPPNPPPPNPPPTYRPPTEAPRSASLSPLIAAEPTTPISLSMSEPRFELTRPRKSRAGFWLLFGAAAAIGAFAARPWLSQRLASSSQEGSQPAAHGALEPPGAPIVTTASVSPLASAEGAHGGVGLAETPPSPSATSRPAWRPRGKHVIIEDTVDPSIEKLRAPTEAEKPAPPPAEPAAAPPPPPPEPPPEPPKSKPAGGSDADRYGI